MPTNRLRILMVTAYALLVSAFFPMSSVATLTDGPQKIMGASFEAGEFEKPQFFVNSALPVVIQSQPGFDGGPPRPVARMRSANVPGDGFYFMENEVYLLTENAQELAQFQSRWPSTVLSTTELGAFGPQGAGTTLYILQVDPSGADTEALNDTVGTLAPELLGQHELSSPAALELFALVMSEISRHGLRVGINAVLETGNLDRREARDAEAAANVMDFRDPAVIEAFPYSRNAFEWPFMKREDQFPSSYTRPLDTGAAEAVRLVGAAGRLGTSVRVMIADAGFYPNEDFPTHIIINGARVPNPAGCGDDDWPPSPESNCAAHGTHVTMTGFAQADNEVGSFSPGGEVADLLLLQSPSLDVVGVIRYAAQGLQAFAADPPRIINISAGVQIPGGLCFAVCEPLDLVVQILRAQGIVTIAAAGNDNLDVDAKREVCFIFFCEEFEISALIPCELDGVICVGAFNSFQTLRAGYSNFGTDGSDGNGVDIFAPGNLYSVNALAADEENESPDDTLQIVTGTSYAAPFTAGVLALVMAANPALSTEQAVACLEDNARSPAGPELLALDALAAVACALGGTHPFVEIRSPRPEESLLRGVESLELLAVVDDYDQASGHTIQWTSSRAGVFATSEAGQTVRGGLINLPIGRQQICARAEDTTGRTDLDCHTVDVRSAPPIVEILQPAATSPRQTYFESSTITLEGTATDLDGPAPTDIEWFITRFGQVRGSPVATTLSASVPASAFGPGDFSVTLSVTDADGVERSRRVEITIVEDPINLPPTVDVSTPGPTTQFFDNAPVRFLINATASDPEDGDIPFADIDWKVSVQGGPLQDLTLGSRQVCVRFGLISGQFTCVEFATQFFVDLLPVTGASSTEFVIQAIVEDSSGQTNILAEDGTVIDNGTLTVFITQLL